MGHLRRRVRSADAATGHGARPDGSEKRSSLTHPTARPRFGLRGVQSRLESGATSRAAVLRWRRPAVDPRRASLRASPDRPLRPARCPGYRADSEPAGDPGRRRPGGLGRGYGAPVEVRRPARARPAVRWMRDWPHHNRRRRCPASSDAHDDLDHVRSCFRPLSDDVRPLVKGGVLPSDGPARPIAPPKSRPPARR